MLTLLLKTFKTWYLIEKKKDKMKMFARDIPRKLFLGTWYPTEVIFRRVNYLSTNNTEFYKIYIFFSSF